MTVQKVTRNHKCIAVLYCSNALTQNYDIVYSDMSSLLSLCQYISQMQKLNRQNTKIYKLLLHHTFKIFLHLPSVCCLIYIQTPSRIRYEYEAEHHGWGCNFISSPAYLNKAFTDTLLNPDVKFKSVLFSFYLNVNPDVNIKSILICFI